MYEDCLKPFYFYRWLPRHVKNNSILRMASLARVLVIRHEVLEARFPSINGIKYHKTVVPFTRKCKDLEIKVIK